MTRAVMMKNVSAINVYDNEQVTLASAFYHSFLLSHVNREKTPIKMDTAPEIGKK